MHGDVLSGVRVLLIEDKSLVMMLLEDSLTETGCEIVDRASRREEALTKVRTLSFDVAVLDVNLNGHQSFDVADCLKERGIPFVFATGYGAASLLARFEGTPILQKPFRQGNLETALRTALEPCSRSQPSEY